MGRTSMIRADSPLETTETETSDTSSADRNRRTSNITATSISSFPDSPLPSDNDGGPTPFYSAKPRPTFRVGSLRRSPLPDRLSPSLRPPHKSSHRRPRSRGEDVSHVVQAPPPLVLLHATILPPRLPWSRAVLESALPLDLKQRFSVLRAQSSGLVAQRGILIAHPQEEFELLEESVLEALGLLPERIGLDGQFRPRTPSLIKDERDDVMEAKECCETCQKVHGRDVGAGWYIRVYAANGLMRAGAWAAAWSEMERVDVEVLPCIDDQVRRELDAAQVVAGSVEDSRQSPAIEAPPSASITNDFQATQMNHHDHPEETMTPQEEQQQQRNETRKPTDDSLPQIYRPKEIPLRILLRNYIYLLLQDRRNLAIMFLGLMLLISTSHGLFTTANLQTTELGRFEGRLEVIGEVSSAAPQAGTPVGNMASLAVDSQSTAINAARQAYEGENVMSPHPTRALVNEKVDGDDIHNSWSKSSPNPAMVLTRHKSLTNA